MAKRFDGAQRKCSDSHTGLHIEDARAKRSAPRHPKRHCANRSQRHPSPGVVEHQPQGAPASPAQTLPAPEPEPKPAQRRSRIVELARIPATLVLFESGPRIAAALADLADGLGAREAAVCRELTKLHEEVRRSDLTTLAHYYSDAA